MKFACVDGPIFDGHQVDFEEAVRRNKMYVDLETESAERQALECRAEAGVA